MSETQTVEVKHIRGIGTLSLGAFRLFLTLSFLLVAALIFATVAFKSARSAQERLDAQQVAENVAQVSQCVGSIAGLNAANIVIDDARQDHLDRAVSAERLAEIDPTVKLKREHTRIAQDQREKAAALVNFPAPTLEQCNMLADRLGVPHQQPVAPPQPATRPTR